MHPLVVAALRRLQREKRTGVFRTEAGGTERKVFLECGAIVSAHSTSLDERLGEHMVRRGRITQQELEDASKLVRSGRRRLGEALVELEIIEPKEADNFARTQLAEIASKLMTEPPKKLQFRDRSVVVKVTAKPVPIADAIIQAARTASRNDEDMKALMDGALVPEVTPDAMSVLETLSLHSHEAFILSRCDGQSDVQGVFAQSPLSEEETARILLGLEHAGIIVMKGPVAEGH